MSVGKRVLSVSGWVLLAILLVVTCLYIIPKSGTHDLRGYIREITEENGCTVISLTSVFSTDEQPDTYLLRVDNARAIRSTEGGSLSADGLTVGQMVDVNVRGKKAADGSYTVRELLVYPGTEAFGRRALGLD